MVKDQHLHCLHKSYYNWLWVTGSTPSNSLIKWSESIPCFISQLPPTQSWWSYLLQTKWQVLFSSSDLGFPKHSENRQLFFTLASNLFMKHFIEIYNFRANGNVQWHNWILANRGMYWCEQKDQDETESWLLLKSRCQPLGIGQCALQDCRKHWLIGDWYGFWCSSLSEKGVFKYLQWALETSKIRME